MALKHLYSGKPVVEIAAHLVVMIFNEGFLYILQVIEVLELLWETRNTSTALRVGSVTPQKEPGFNKGEITVEWENFLREFSETLVMTFRADFWKCWFVHFYSL